ncbi:MAG: ADP-glyceromanno-heptose 6-epimerase [Saprospiraceae bacterium]
MEKNKTIIVTGAAGFIGSCMVTALNSAGYHKIVLVDDFNRTDKKRNYENKRFLQLIDRDIFPEWLEANASSVDTVFHLGARTDTTEQDWSIFLQLNLDYSKAIWKICTKHQLPLIYASSAATYGLGELGYIDDHSIVDKLKPLNPYGDSKNEFDKWVLSQKETPPKWYGLKFFNVYGPNEYHKGRMASVIFHTFLKIKDKGEMQLFRSHRADFKDGEQSRDFVYVKDVAKVLLFLFEKQPETGIYNLGTGTERTFLDLAKNTFLALDLQPQISFIDTPVDIRNTYQYYTRANMDKLRSAGYTANFYTLEEGIQDYVKNYLVDKKYW